MADARPAPAIHVHIRWWTFPRPVIRSIRNPKSEIGRLSLDLVLLPGFRQTLDISRSWCILVCD